VEKYTVGIIGNTSTVTDPLGTLRTTNVSTIIGVQKPFNVSQPCSTPGCGNALKSTATTYDANGNVASLTDFKSNLTCYAYDLSRNLETTRIEGLTTATTCATALAAMSLAAPARKITTTWHATYRLPLTITEPAAGGGTKTTTNNFDTAGNLLSLTVATPAGTRVWSWTYDAFGRVLTATDPHSHVTTNTYYANTSGPGLNRGLLASVANALNQTTTIDSYNAHGQPLQMTDANGLVTTMTYDARQRLHTRNVGGETTTYDYDNVGQLHQVTMPDGSTLTYTYDAAHRLTRIQDGLGNYLAYTLDNMGNRTAEEARDPGNTLVRTHTRVIDALNRIKKDIGGANPMTEITQYEYDDNGNQTKITDPINHATNSTYDALNRLKQVTDAANGLTQYQYDQQDNLTQVTDPKNLNTTYAYNGFNEMLTQSSPDTGSTTFTYYAGGNLNTRTDARGVTATYSYDALERVTQIAYTDETVTYTYDTCTNGVGRLCSIADKTGTTSFGYDTHGRVTQKTQTLTGLNGLVQTIAYSYNAAGQLTGETLPSGKAVTYTYVNNRITGVSVNGTAILQAGVYQPFGPIQGWAWGNDSMANPNKFNRSYDLSGRTTLITSSSTVDPLQILYDAASRITDLQKLTGNAVDTTKSASYGYDNLDRLTSLTPGAGNSAAAQGFTYDAVGNRLTNTIAASTTNYGYVYGTSGHRLMTLSGATSKTFTYDNAGNKTADNTQTWTYGNNNRPVSVTAGANTVLTGINALGQRVLKTVNGTVTRFVYDEAGRLIGEYDVNGVAAQEIIWLNDLPVAVVK